MWDDWYFDIQPSFISGTTIQTKTLLTAKLAHFYVNFVYTQLSKLHTIMFCYDLSNLVQQYVEVHLRVHFTSL